MATKRRDDPSFTSALQGALNEIRNQYSDTWRSLSDRLGLPESLISLYRSGDRYPSVSAMLEIEQFSPGFIRRLTDLYYRFETERALRARRYE